MSVEKMEQYKEYKKHRKEILRKQKRREQMVQISIIIGTVLIIGVVAFFIYQDVKPDYSEQYTSLIDWNQYITEETVADEEEETTEEDTDTEESESTTEDTDANESSETQE